MARQKQNAFYIDIFRFFLTSIHRNFGTHDQEFPFYLLTKEPLLDSELIRPER